jgi:hypothetical protein
LRARRGGRRGERGNKPDLVHGGLR